MSPLRLKDLVRSKLPVSALTLATTASASAQGPAADNMNVNARDRLKGAGDGRSKNHDDAVRLATQKIRVNHRAWNHD
jgi:hypothetical protein